MGARQSGPLQININQHTALAVTLAAGTGFAAGCLVTASLSRSRTAQRKLDHRPSYRQTEDSESEPSTPRSTNDDPNYLKLLLIVNLDANMGLGKTAVQCAHAAVCQFKKLLKKKDSLLFRWEQSGAPKVCVGIDSEEALLAVRTTAKARGLSTFSVEDPRSATGGKTVLAIGPAPGSSIDEVAGHLKLLA